MPGCPAVQTWGGRRGWLKGRTAVNSTQHYVRAEPCQSVLGGHGPKRGVLLHAVVSHQGQAVASCEAKQDTKIDDEEKINWV